MAAITYTLRIIGRLPDSIPLARLGQYVQEFAELLGAENEPRFSKIKKASIGIVAKVPESRKAHTYARLRSARERPESRAGRSLQRIEALLGQDHAKGATMLDPQGEVIFALAVIQPTADETITIRQRSTVDGILTGLIGADETMNLHLRDDFHRDINLIVRDEALAISVLKYFRRATLRLVVNGLWERTDAGWVPKASKCIVESFEVLEELSVRETLDRMANVPDNGWNSFDDPLAVWKDLRGSH